MALRLYNCLSKAFPKRAIVRMDANDTQGKETQQHLVSALKQLGATGFNESADAAELLTRLRDLLGAGPVLLCVDNALTATQLDGLLPSGVLNSFQRGSWIIVTSRFAGLKDSASYRVSVLQCRLCWGPEKVSPRARAPCLMVGACVGAQSSNTIAHRPWRPSS